MAPESGYEVLRDVVGRFDGIFRCLVLLPKDDTSNVIAGSYIPFDHFNRISCLVGSVIA